MSILFWTLWVVYALIAARWVLGTRELRQASLGELRLDPLTDFTPQTGDTSVTVLIAAHNESDNIESCLNELRTQNYPLHEIIVIDDRSTDGTGAIIKRLAAKDERIKLVTIESLPSGWIGKTHALANGSRHATGDYLLFVDSDVDLRPGCVAAIMQKVQRDGIDFLTLWPRLGLRSLADRILVPPIGWLLSFWSWTSAGGPEQMTGPNSSELVMGNGQFLLMRRTAYEKIGGHDAVRAELAEDAVLAINAHQHQLKRFVGLGTGLYVASRNSTFARCSNGLARVVIGSIPSVWKILFSTQIVLGGCFTPFWILPLSLYLISIGVAPLLCGLFAATTVVHVIAMFITLRGLFDLTMEERGSIWWYPVGCLFAVYILLWSLWIMTGRGTIRWGATHYTVSGSRILAMVER